MKTLKNKKGIGMVLNLIPTNNILIQIRGIKNMRDGHHLNSKYWQNWKKRQLGMSKELYEIAFGMVLSDAGMSRKSNEAMIKFEQRANQKDFLYHLFTIFKAYCFMMEPGIRYHSKGPLEGQIKSYWFKTFSHQTFSEL